MAAAPAPPPVLLLLLLLPLPLCVVATLPEPKFLVLPKPPVVLNATNETLVVNAHPCPPHCGFSYLAWEIKPWVDTAWRRDGVMPLFSNFTFRNLTPGVAYDVRALVVPRRGEQPHLTDDVPVIRAYTCADIVPEPRRLRITERRDDHFVVKWSIPENACASTKFLFQLISFSDEDERTIYDLPDTCLPPHLMHKQPRYHCGHEKQVDGHRDCTARIDNIHSKERYYIGLVAVDWSGSCSKRDWDVSVAKRVNTLGFNVAPLAISIVSLLLLAAIAPYLYKHRKRLLARAADGRRLVFSRAKPVNASAPVESDRDGYLLPDALPRPADRPLPDAQPRPAERPPPPPDPPQP